MNRVRENFFLLLAVIATASLVIQSASADEKVYILRDRPVAMKSVDAKAMARELLTETSYRCLMELIYLESRGNPASHNKKSGARGIGQILPSTYRILGLRHSNDEKVQLIAMLAYLTRHYGGTNAPCKALAFHRIHHYY
jgi:Transglycosylase SLT domain